MKYGLATTPSVAASDYASAAVAAASAAAAAAAARSARTANAMAARPAWNCPDKQLLDLRIAWLNCEKSHGSWKKNSFGLWILAFSG